MGEKSSKPASTPTGAVFLSYVSQDAEAAQKICGALRAAGIEVWFARAEFAPPPGAGLCAGGVDSVQTAQESSSLAEP